ncbi:hypothetical protein N836_11780 [Leptolyngbya sp. Heron Island J]|nr:hypothetical protein N836_11780 [Leptolyngbya sp. Heron Island J]
MADNAEDSVNFLNAPLSDPGRLVTRDPEVG